MKSKFLRLKSQPNYRLAAIALTAFCASQLQAQKTFFSAQKTGDRYNTVVSNGSSGLSSPMQSHSVIVGGFQFYYGDGTILNSDASTPTTVTASRDLAALGIVLFGGDAYVHFRNTGLGNLNAGTTTYFTLKERPTNTGISLNAGGLLGISELSSIKGTAYAGAANYNLGSTIGTSNKNEGTVAGTSITRLLIDSTGKWYAAVTPNAAYNAVRLDVAFSSGLINNLANVSAQIKTNVYNAFTEANPTGCQVRPRYTNEGDATGITLNTGALGIQLNQVVSNPERAINPNVNDYSSFSTGVANVGVASTISQTFYFPGGASATDAVQFDLALLQSLVDVSLLGNNISFDFYNGSSETAVATKQLSGSLLGLNLANLVSVDAIFKKLNVSVLAGAAFDRVKVSLNSGLVNAQVIGGAFRIYDVKLGAPKPTLNADTVRIYAGQTPNVTATSAGNDIVWYNAANTQIGTGGAFPVAVNATGDYYAVARRTGCTDNSQGTYLHVIVLNVGFTPSTLPVGTTGTPYSQDLNITGDTVKAPFTFSLSAGTLPPGLTLNTATGLISGTPLTPGFYTFTLGAADNTSTPAVTQQYTIRVVAPLALPPVNLPNATVNTAYPVQTLPAATGGVTPYTYQYQVLPGQTGLGAGLSFDPATRQITGTPTATGVYTFTVKATDSLGTTASTAYILNVVAALTPDLTIDTYAPDVLFVAAAQEKEAIISVNELLGNSTVTASEGVTIIVSKPSSFDVAFDGGISSILSIPVNNSDWEVVSNTSSTLTIRTKSGVNIAGMGSSSVGLKFTLKTSPTPPLRATQNITFSLKTNTGTELTRDNYNNSKTIIVSISRP